jgi:hypothetical protein
MSRANHADVFVGEQRLADMARPQVGNIAQREIDLAAPHRGAERIDHPARDVESDPGRDLGQPCEQRRQEIDLAHVRHRDSEHPVRRRRIEMRELLHGVGAIPSGVRTNSESPSNLRRRPSAWLTAGWVMPSRSPAAVRLRRSQ